MSKITYEELREILIEGGFKWVADNIDLTIEDGIRQEYVLPRYLENSLKTRKEKVIGTRPFTEKEKMDAAIKEIENSLIFPLSIANDLPAMLGVESIEIGDFKTPVDTAALGSITEIVQLLKDSNDG